MHEFRQESRFRNLCRLASCVLLLLLNQKFVDAQTARPPFTDPTWMFEEMFGEDRPEDRAALEKIEISISEERQLGQKMVQDALEWMKSSEIPIEKDGRDVEYLQSLVETLQPFMKQQQRYKKIRVLVAGSPRIDARSFPGGTLIFFEGLLEAVENEAALIGIVGHELSHLDRGHQLFPIKRMKLIEKSLSTPGSGMQFMPGQAMAKLWSRPFRPEDERDADWDGVAWSYAAGYDPRELAKLFGKQGETSGSKTGTPWATFYRSHPDNHERQDAIIKQFGQLHKKKTKAQPLFIGRDNLIQRKSRKQSGE